MQSLSVNPTVERPSLLGAKLRSQRAGEHLQQLEAIVNEFERQNPDPVVVTVDSAALARGEVRDVRFDWSRSRLPPAKRIGVIAGEALYNLRAALDYLAFGLAWLDAGHPQEQTQFPIADSERQWEGQVRSRLVGLSAAHKASIERYQPFRGCEWTRALRDLSNPDKHRTLTSVFAQFEGPMTPDPATAQPVPGQPGRASVTAAGQKAGIYFWNESPVAETLQTLGVEVARVLIEFQRDFGEADTLTIRPDHRGSDERTT